jgi:hypothetical protein
MGEHAKHNKGRPYKTSAGVPYIISYPNKIKKGKVIHTAYSSVDFAPTLLSLMNVENTDLQFDGLDGSAELLSKTKVSNNEKQIRFVSDSTNAKWAAAVTGSHMLVVSSAGPPWLFDLQEDPDEMYNVFETGNHTLVSNEMITEMYDAMHEYELPIKDQEFLFMSKPACFDSYDQLPAMKDVLCSDLLNSKFSIGCQFRHIYEKCSVSCGVCCEDSSGKIWLNGKMKGCNSLRSACGIRRVQKFCPRTCNTCYQEDFDHDEFKMYYDFDDDEGDDNLIAA